MGWLGNAWDRVSGAVVSVVSAPFKAETYEAIGNAASTAVSAVGSAAAWTYDNALKPAGNVIGTTVSAIWDEDSRQKVGNAVSTAANAVGDYAKFVWENPALAGRQAVQGLSNSVTGLTAFVGDAVWWVGESTLKAGYNTVVGAINLGANDGERIVDYAGFSKFSRIGDWMEEHTGSWAGYTRAQLDEMVRAGTITEREASYAAGTKYGFQAVGEVASFVVITAATAGAGGAALAAARGSSVGLRVAQAGHTLAETGRLGRIAAQPLLWMGENVAATRGAANLQRLASAAETAPEIRSFGWLRNNLGPLRAYDPAQTTHAFANNPLARYAVSSGNESLGYGLRWSENTWRFFNPIEANGNLFSRHWRRAVVPWTIEAGGAALSYTSNQARESRAAETVGVVDQAGDTVGDRQAEEFRRRLGLPPSAPPGGDPNAVPAAPPTGVPPAVPPAQETVPQPLRGGFQDNAQPLEGITHTFTINNGLVQPTTLDPLAPNGTDTTRAPVTPGLRGNR